MSKEHLKKCLQHGIDMRDQKAACEETVLEIVTRLYNKAEVRVFHQTEILDVPPWAVSCTSDEYWLECFYTKEEAEQFAIDFGLPVVVNEVEK